MLRSVDTVLRLKMSIEMVLSAESSSVVFTSSVVAIVSFAIRVVLWNMPRQIFAVLEALVAMLADVLSALIRLMRSKMVREVALRG